MSSTNLEPNELDQSIVFQNNYMYKWDILNFNCKIFPAHATLPSISFVLYLDGIRHVGKLELRGPDCHRREISFTCTCDQNIELSVKLSVDKTNLSRTCKYDGKFLVPLFDQYAYCRLPEKSITIFCEIMESKWKKPGLFQKNIEIKSKLKCSLVELFENKHFWDVTFLVAEREIHAHKCILATRSKVFAAMFKHEMEENKLNRVTLTDIDPEVFVEMLRFIYTDEVLNLNKIASGLFNAGDKYDIQDLKLRCENEMVNSLTVENAAESLIFSDCYGAKNLKNYVVDFINYHKKSVLNTEGWKQIVNNHTDLLFELYLNI